MKQYRIVLLLLVAVGLLQGTTFAAEAGTGLAWDSVLLPLESNVVHTVAPAIINVMIAVSGLMVMFGEQNQYKTFFNIVLGIGLALQFGDFLYDQDFGFGAYLNPATQTAQTTMYQVTLTDNGDTNFLSGFMNNYINHIVAPGAEAIKGPALKLLGILVMIDMTISFSLGLIKVDKIKYLLQQILMIGFYIFLIENWVAGTYGISELISASFEKLGYTAAGGSLYNPDSIVQNGIQIFNVMWASMSKLGVSSIGVLLADLIILVGVIFTTFLTAIEMFMVRIEFWTVALITIPLLPFGVNKHLKFLSEKAIGAVFNLGIKCSVIAFISAVSGPLLTGFIQPIVNSKEQLPFNLLLQLLLGCIVVCMLTLKIPALTQGLISGSPSLASGDMMAPIKSAAAVASAASGVGAAAGGMYGAAKMASNMQGGATALKAAGVTGENMGGGKMGSLKALAMRQAGTAQNLAGIAGNAANQKFNPFARGSQAAQSNTQSRYSALQQNKDAGDMSKQVYQNEKTGMKEYGWQPIPGQNTQANRIENDLDQIKKAQVPNNSEKK
jgi:type IV secretion system protein TrbL